ncbi:MAG TPA: hypothetical protein VF510_10210 [Ktedonobacterales bacterium]
MLTIKNRATSMVERLTHKLNARTHTLVSKVITPVVLLLGLLVLLLAHFNGVLKITKAQDDLFHGQTAFSLGRMQYAFMTASGTNRPNISYAGVNVMTYIDWDSTISIDGQVSNLWDNFHGYDYDQTLNSTNRQFFSTTSGPGWQVVQVVNLVDDHTVTVHYDFVARTQGIAEPHHVVLTIEHAHASWYPASTQNNVFTAGLLPGRYQGSISSDHQPRPIGTVTLSVNGPAVPPNTISFVDAHGNATLGGGDQQLLSVFTTTYIIDNPQVNRLTPLGTETLTYTSAIAQGTPIPAPHITPTPAP